MTTMPIYNMTDTWNSGGTTFTSIKMNVTDSASAAASLLIDLQIATISKFKVDKSGNTTLAATAGINTADGVLILGANNNVAARGGNFGFGSAGSLFWTSASNNAYSGTQDLFLARDAANTLAQRNSTTAQTFNMYKTYTDASNYERLGITVNGSSFTLLTEQLGTGTARALYIGTSGAAGLNFRVGGVDPWQITSSGNFITGTDNTYDIGASGATRPRTIYAATSISSAGSIAAGTSLSIGAGNGYVWNGRSIMFSPADGQIKLSNNANNDFSLLQFGGTTASFPAIKRSTTGIEFRLADDSTGTWFRGAVMTVASLPTAASVGNGGRMYVTDATALVFGTTVAGSGALSGPIYSDGTNWKAG